MNILMSERGLYREIQHNLLRENCLTEKNFDQRTHSHRSFYIKSIKATAGMFKIRTN